MLNEPYLTLFARRLGTFSLSSFNHPDPPDKVRQITRQESSGYGMDVPTVMKMTGLTEKEIKQLRH